MSLLSLIGLGLYVLNERTWKKISAVGGPAETINSGKVATLVQTLRRRASSIRYTEVYVTSRKQRLKPLMKESELQCIRD
jgi:hypothetical protein